MQAPALPCSSSAVTSCQRSLLLTSAQLNSARKRMQRYKLPGQRQNNKETFFRKRQRFSQFLTNRRQKEGHTLIIYYKDRQKKNKKQKRENGQKGWKDGAGKGGEREEQKGIGTRQGRELGNTKDNRRAGRKGHAETQAKG